MAKSVSSMKPETRFSFKIPKGYSVSSRRRIAREAIRRIQKRTEKGIDRFGYPFKGYSEEYADSLEGRIGGKKEGARANLRLTGDMMSSLEIIKIESEQVTIGIIDSEEVPKAHGHITGADGNLPIRNFMGLPETEIKSIIRQFPKETETRRREVEEDFVSNILATEGLSFDQTTDILSRALVQIEETTEPRTQ